MMKQMMSEVDSQFKMISQRIQALEERIKKANVPKYEFETESEVDGDSDESDSN